MTLRRLAAPAAGAALLSCLGVAAAPAAASTAIPIDCAHAAAVAAAEPQAGHNQPGEPAPVLFASDFPALTDCEWGWPLGGWGGSHRDAPRKHRPVIFVHGNQADAENWYLVADYFRDHGGYTPQEMYALSYNGLGNAYAGLPSCCGPAPESTTYWEGTPVPMFAFCCEGGKGASDDPNVPDLYEFVRAVQDYTGSRDVDIVAHSLGVTVTRKMLMVHPELRPHVKHAVMIAGANHGTTICRGLDTTYYGCDEIAPGSAWLNQLNAAGEAPGPTKWMSIYAGDNSDIFFQDTGVNDDRQSPHLDGAVNVMVPGGLPVGSLEYHNDERVMPRSVAVYLQFLQDVSPAAGHAPGATIEAAPPGLPPAGAAPATPGAAGPGIAAAGLALLALPGLALGYSWIAFTSRNSSSPSGPSSRPRPDCL